MTAAPVPVGGPPYETWRFAASIGDVEFEAAPAAYAGEIVLRDGAAVMRIDTQTLRRADAPRTALSGDERDRIIDELRDAYRAGGAPFDLALATGEVEDENGVVRPGFRSLLPRAEHSRGWTVTDLFLSPDHPSADDYPPYVEYAEKTGTARIPRTVQVDETEGIRRQVLGFSGAAWVGERAGESLTADDARRIATRVRIVYDWCGIDYVVR